MEITHQTPVVRLPGFRATFTYQPRIAPALPLVFHQLTVPYHFLASITYDGSSPHYGYSHHTWDYQVTKLREDTSLDTVPFRTYHLLLKPYENLEGIEVTEGIYWYGRTALVLFLVTNLWETAKRKKTRAIVRPLLSRL